MGSLQQSATTGERDCLNARHGTIERANHWESGSIGFLGTQSYRFKRPVMKAYERPLAYT